MRLGRSAAAAALVTTLGLGIAAGPAAADTDPQALIDALNAVFGLKEGVRTSHTNGFCVKGSFTSTDAAAGLSKAKHLASKGPWPVIGRFSMGGGNPQAPNTQKDNVRGLAIHIDLGDDTATDMVMISAPIFGAKSPEKFLELLQTVATKDKAKIGAFFAANPESTRQKAWLMERPVPSSYAATSYFGVHTFTLTNAEGKSQIIKWKLVPQGGEVGLNDDEVKGKAPDFYKPELATRLAEGPVVFDVTAILGEPGDAIDDPTVLWPEGRKAVKMGELSIAALEDDKTCDAGIFDPTLVTDGIEGPANDGIFHIRSPAYAISFSRRAQ